MVLVVPGPIETRTGGYEYDRRIAAALRARGCRVDVVELAGGFPDPADAALEGAGQRLAAFPDRTIVIVDGLALPGLPAIVEREARRLRIVALVHMPVVDESGLDPVRAARLHAAECRALAAVSLIVVTGRATMTRLAQGGVSRDRLVLVEPGTDPAPIARGSGDPATVHLVCVATVGPGKGHDILVQALADLPCANWRLTCAGSLDRYPATVDALHELIHRRRLDDRVSLVGELDREGLAPLYESADVFVLATRHESYGMAVAEAISHGLPVVSTTTGAIPALVGDDAGVLVEPGDSPAFARALAPVIESATLRASLAEGARRARSGLPTWESAAAALVSALATRL